MSSSQMLLFSKVTVMLVLYMFLPLTAFTYYVFRRRRRTYEVERIFAILHIDPAYRRIYEDENAGRYYLWAVGYVSVVASLGLMLLFLGPELGVDEFPRVPFGTTTGTATRSHVQTSGRAARPIRLACCRTIKSNPGSSKGRDAFRSRCPPHSASAKRDSMKRTPSR